MKLTTEQKEQRKLERQEAKRIKIRLLQIEADKNQKPVSFITFAIEWSRQGNPTCTAWVHYTDGTAQQMTSRAGGWGYCKESSVIADIFNHSLRYKLYQIDEAIEKPYGISCYDGKRYFAGGIGTNCYYWIAEYIGGTFKKVASGKTFDAYEFTMKKF
jgi:hypothetical protein